MRMKKIFLFIFPVFPLVLTTVQRVIGFNLDYPSPSLRITLILKRMTGRTFQFVLSSIVDFVNFRGEIRRFMIGRIRCVA